MMKQIDGKFHPTFDESSFVENSHFIDVSNNPMRATAFWRVEFWLKTNRKGVEVSIKLENSNEIDGRSILCWADIE